MAKKPKPRTGAGTDGLAGRAPRGEVTNHRYPLFSLQHVVAGFSVSNCERDEKAAFADRLQQLGQMTWEQIQLGSRQGVGTETIGRDSICLPIPNHITPEVRILALRIRQKARIIGYRQDEVFHIVWIDPKHRVYKG